jgi:ParB family transcriptional regulator, chromosome partitioning protein
MVRRAGLGRGLDALLPPVDQQASAASAPLAPAQPPAPARVVAAPAPPPPASPPVLESLSPRAPEASSAGRGLQRLPIAAIRPNSYQPRSEFDDEALDALAESIRELGVLQPVLVRPLADADGAELFELIAGERRWRAARAAGLREVPALVREGVDDRQALQEALVENVQREDLGPLEEAAAYQQLVDEFGLTQDQVAKAVGRGRPTVANTLRLLQLPAPVQRMVADGLLSAGHARTLLAIDDRQALEAMAQAAVRAGWSVRVLEEAVRTAARAEPPPAPRPRQVDRPAAILEVEERLGTRLDTRVQVQLGAKHGKLLVSFADLDDLDRIFRLLAPEEDGEVDLDGST